MTAELHNVDDRRRQWIGGWEIEPLDYDKLTVHDLERTVIYQDVGRAQAGTLHSWRNGVGSMHWMGPNASAANMSV